MDTGATVLMAHRLTLVTIAVERVEPDVWAWTVDGPAGTDHGTAPTEGEAWAVARAAAVTVRGRLEVPRGGGGQLAAAIEGPRCLP